MIPKATTMVLVIVGIALVLMLAPLMAEPGGLQHSFSFAPSGHRAVLELVERSGREIRRWRRLPISLDGTGRALLMLEPDSNLMLEAGSSHEHLAAWVGQGNDLILVPRKHDAFVVEMLNQEFEQTGIDLLSSQACSTLLEAFRMERTPRLEADVLADLDFHVGADPGPLFLESEDGPTGLELQLPVPFTVDDPAPFQVRYRVQDRPALLEAKHGGGRVVLILAPELFHNRHLATADHAAAVLTLLQGYGPEGLLLDEFHHGLPEAEGLLYLFFRPPFLGLSIAVLGFLGLYLWSVARRRQPLEERRPTSRRSKREHLDALGQLLAGAQDRRGILLRLMEGLEADARRRMHVGPELPLERLLEILEAQKPEACAEFRSLREELLVAGQLGHGDQSLQNWGRRAHRLRQVLRYE